MLLQLFLFGFAHAQDAVEAGSQPELNAQVFRPTIDGQRTLWSDDATRGVDRSATARLLFHYTSNPLVFTPEGGEEVALVSSIVQADLLAGYTFDRLRIGVDLPVYLLANGDQANQVAGLGDLAPDLKLTLLDGPDAPVNVAINGRLVLPTATTTTIALKNPSLGYELSVIVDRSFGDVLLAANVGTRSGPNLDLSGVHQNDRMVFRTAAGYAFTDSVGTSLEFAGRLDYASLTSRGSSPVEVLLGGYGRAADDIVVRGGVGTGLTAGVGSPELRLMLGAGYEPQIKRDPVDSDGDGLVDREDDCPGEPEDRDSFEDDDGCPDLDNDKDGILDKDDTCRDEPEDKDGYQDDDGCADPLAPVSIIAVDENGELIKLAKLVVKGKKSTKSTNPYNKELSPGDYVVDVIAGSYETTKQTFKVVNGPEKVIKVVLKKTSDVVVTKDRIDLKDKVYFATGKAAIKSVSFTLLDQAVKILEDYPEIRELRIEGHTDSRGSASYNLKLSQSRAASVREYFISKGIDAGRLTAQGFGEAKPLDSGNNEAAWSKNRRVDFVIDSWVDQE